MNNDEREKWVNRLYELNVTSLKYHSDDFKDIMIKLTNNKLFKYRSGSLNDILNLSNNKLPFCSADTLNDPFECEYRLKGLEEKYDNDIYWKYLKEYSIEFKNEIHICSFSENNADILMWAHYANNHKGFCIEFDVDELFYGAFQIILPVLYTQEMPLISVDNPEEVKKIIYTKAKQWEYELEWRISTIIADSKEKFMLLDVPKPKAIYLGCKIEDGLKNYLLDFCEKNEIRIYQGEKNRKEFKIDFKELNLSCR